MNLEYIIESRNLPVADFIRSVLRIHGLQYPWKTKQSSWLPDKSIKILVSLTNNVVSKEFTILLSTNPETLAQVGVRVGMRLLDQQPTWGVVFSKREDSSTPGIPALLRYVTPILTSSCNWSVDWIATGANIFAQPIAMSQGDLAVIGIDFYEYLKDAITGMPWTKGMVDWAEVYGNKVTQDIVSSAHIDSFIGLFRSYLMDLIPWAFPFYVDFYPPNRTPPLLITGDTDDASNYQLEYYFHLLKDYEAHGTILIKDFTVFSESLLKNGRQQGHCFGVHPFSERGIAQEYQQSFEKLQSFYTKIFNEPIYAIRNHRFQFIPDVHEEEQQVIFNLNCVTAHNNTWIGSASGIAYPIPYPREITIMDNFLPLHLPTIIEDDVFLYKLDYCYKSLTDGDTMAYDAILSFLETWIVRRRWPLIANLHPEHGTTNNRGIFTCILQWANSSEIWMPGLSEFWYWISSRNKVELSISSDEKNQLLQIHLPNDIRICLKTRTGNSMIVGDTDGELSKQGLNKGKNTFTISVQKYEEY